MGNIDATLEAAGAAGASGESEKKPRDGCFAEVGIRDPAGTLVDVSVKGWKV